MRRPAYFLLPVLCLACLLSVIFSTSQLNSQSGSKPESVAQFRIAVGLTDSAPKDWQGTLSVTGGEIASAKGWRFSQQDSVEPNGAFQFRTKIGALENQLLTAHPYGATGWNDKAAQRLIPEGLIVRVKGSGRVRFESASGAFEFNAADLAAR